MDWVNIRYVLHRKASAFINLELDAKRKDLSKLISKPGNIPIVKLAEIKNEIDILERHQKRVDSIHCTIEDLAKAVIETGMRDIFASHLVEAYTQSKKDLDSLWDIHQNIKNMLIAVDVTRYNEAFIDLSDESDEEDLDFLDLEEDGF